MLLPETGKAIQLFDAVRDGIRYNPFDIGTSADDYRASRIATEIKLLTDEFLELLLDAPEENQPTRRRREPTARFPRATPTAIWSARRGV